MGNKISKASYAYSRYMLEKRLTMEGKFVELCAHLDKDPLCMIQNDSSVNSYTDAVALLKDTYANLA